MFTCPEALPDTRRRGPRRFNKGMEMADVHLHDYVRMKLNDAIVPLEQLAHCERRSDGLCLKENFVRSHADRNEQGWWDKCRAK